MGRWIGSQEWNVVGHPFCKQRDSDDLPLLSMNFASHVLFVQAPADSSRRYPFIDPVVACESETITSYVRRQKYRVVMVTQPSVGSGR